MDFAARKSQARKAAFACRKASFDSLGPDVPTQMEEVLARFQGKSLAGYMPIRSEISPLQFMVNHDGEVSVPVIQGVAQALQFSRWTPEIPMVEGPFGARIPEVTHYVTPEVLIVPLVAFDDYGNRLGYGGGFYDRTLEGLRTRGKAIAIGFAFEDQRAENLPIEATDQPLDFIVTEARIRSFSG